MTGMDALAKYFYLGKAYLNTSIPTHMVYFVTARCNAKCPHCFYWDKTEKAKPDNELSIDEINSVAKNMRGLIQMSLTGGEPFLRDDFSEIVRSFYKRARTRYFTISTNGSLTDKMERDLLDILPDTPQAFYRVSISLDDTAGAHDERRAINGLTDKIKKTVKILNGLKKDFDNLSVSMVTTMDAGNQNRLKDIYEYISGNFEVDDWGIGLIRGNPRDPAAKCIDVNNYKAFYENIKSCGGGRPFIVRNLRKLLEREISLKVEILEKKAQVIPCLALRRTVILREDGAVEPCEMIYNFIGKESVLGNVRDYDYSVKNILGNENSRRALNFIKSKKCYCTYECALHCSVFYNPGELVRAILRG